MIYAYLHRQNTTYLQQAKMNSHKVWHGGTVDGERETRLWVKKLRATLSKHLLKKAESQTFIVVIAL